jgi:hypothetical protein
MKETVTTFAPRLQVAIACLLCLGAGAVSLHHSNKPVRQPFVVTALPHTSGTQFVIADLDGDRKPDLALVETGSPRRANYNYSIRLQFSTAPISAIDVRAPLGGLQVAARDVNGDDNVDLIVTSNLDESFIEVLLNDGHGNFSMAEPGAYPKLENKSHVLLRGPNGLVADQAMLASLRSFFGEEIVRGHDRYRILSWDSLSLAKEQTASYRTPHPRLGRSPPVLVALS